MNPNDPLYLAPDETPAGVNNSLFIRAVRYVYNDMMEPVVLFLEELSEKATRAFVERRLKEIDKP